LENAIVKGKIVSGKGEGSNYIQLPWVRKQITDKTGFTPYDGTLNIMLFDACEVSQRLQCSKYAEITPAKGFFSAKLFKAKLRNVECAILIPQIPDYPKDILEIVAPENLKSKLHVKDGEVVELFITSQ
jgi:riboflavin kinase